MNEVEKNVLECVAYISDYCKSKKCKDCIFGKGKHFCMLDSEGGMPSGWKGRVKEKMASIRYND